MHQWQLEQTNHVPPPSVPNTVQHTLGRDALTTDILKPHITGMASVHISTANPLRRKARGMINRTAAGEGRQTCHELRRLLDLWDSGDGRTVLRTQQWQVQT